MNIREAILAEHSKAQTNRIVQFIGNNEQRFEELMNLFLYDEYRVCQRAAWVVSGVGDIYPELLEPYIVKMLENLQNKVHPAVIRNTVRVLNNIKELPDSSLGLAATLCFQYLETPSVPVAIRVHAMRLLYKISLKEPELKNELRLLIENFMEYESAAFLAAGREILTKLSKKPNI